MTKMRAKTVSRTFAKRAFNRIGGGFHDPYAHVRKAVANHNFTSLCVSDDAACGQSMVYCPMGMGNINPAHLTTFRKK